MKRMVKTVAVFMMAMMVLISFSACKAIETKEASEKTEQAKTEQAKTESTKTKSAKTESAKTESAKTAETFQPEKIIQGEEQLLKKDTTILVAAAASLNNVFDERLIPMFEAANPGIHVQGTYDSSGKLQTQIEEGLEADVFLSASMKQMDALRDENLIDADTVVELLENKIVLITAADNDSHISAFEDVVAGDIIAIGDPESVPAGQYAKEALTALGLWEAVETKASLGTNVTEVLNWVAEGSADTGIVYATDAAANGHVKIIAEAPKGTLSQPVRYPVGLVTASDEKEAAQKFVDF